MIWLYGYGPCSVSSRVTHEIYNGHGPSTYVYFVGCYWVIESLCAKKGFDCVFTLLYNFVDDFECPWTMRSLYSYMLSLTDTYKSILPACKFHKICLIFIFPNVIICIQCTLSMMTHLAMKLENC